MWFEPGVQLNTCGAVAGVPSTTIPSPGGDVCTVMPTFAVKFAVTLTGADMVTVVAALFALAAGPVQLVNTNPEFAVAEMFCTEPAAKNVPLAGVTVPPFTGEAATVSICSVLKFAVKVAADAGATTACAIAPASLHVLNTYRVPPEPCGVDVAIVWFEPGVQLNTCGAV